MGFGVCMRRVSSKNLVVFVLCIIFFNEKRKKHKLST